MITLFGIMFFCILIFVYTPIFKTINFLNKPFVICFKILLIISGILTIFIILEKFNLSFINFCTTCPLFGRGISIEFKFTEYVRYFFDGLFYYSISIIPLIILFSWFSGLLKQIKITSIKNPIWAFLVAAILPICSCSIFPIIYSLENRNRWETISKIIFFLTTPLISPLIIFLSIQQLGLNYLIHRLLFTLVFVILSSVIISLFIKPTSQAIPVFQCNLLNNNQVKSPVIPYSISIFKDLLPSISLGIILGTVIALIIPMDIISVLFQRKIISVFLFSFSGIPLYFCGGSDILILTPLIYMDLPIPFSFAFSITGAGICTGSLPLIFKTFKWKFALLILSIYIILPPVLALIWNFLFTNIGIIDRGI